MQKIGKTDAVQGDDLWLCELFAQFQCSNPKYTKGFQNPKVEEMQKNAETFQCIFSPGDPQNPCRNASG